MPRKRTLYPCVHMPAMSRHDRLRLIKLTGSFGIPSRDSCSDRLALAGPARSPASLFSSSFASRHNGLLTQVKLTRPRHAATATFVMMCNHAAMGRRQLLWPYQWRTRVVPRPRAAALPLVQPRPTVFSVALVVTLRVRVGLAASSKEAHGLGSIWLAAARRLPPLVIPSSDRVVPRMSLSLWYWNRKGTTGRSHGQRSRPSA